jgi:hypothetical protein
VDGSGNLYFVDRDAFKAYKAAPSAGGYTITEIGSGFSGLSAPTAVAVGGDGTVYIATCWFSCGVWEETPLATGGYTQSEAVPNGANYIWAIAVDGQNNLYLGVSNVLGFPSTEPTIAIQETLSGGSYTESVIAAVMEPVNANGLALDGSGNV